ncbi:6-phosphogluconolactonase|uniref:6-phosphogluconolactonase n=1 Tax=Neochlamydia sp. AcF84 TaxID=2315858 RepID=UPI0014097A08|nr:6-phosphogluconolactonase [Neochlamydia sp. AcF84]NGY94701.1 6-phosphogluconolactonase [Neochlamydia sp. AcF84]
MLNSSWKTKIQVFDDRRDLVAAGNYREALLYCVEQFINLANTCIENQGYFAVALSGGSTPKAIFQILTSLENRERIDWSKVLLFWSDERSVPPTHPESNYLNAMEAGFNALPLKATNIFRMQAENNIEENARHYQHLIQTKIPKKNFDAVLLGMGEDGHTASLFPQTSGLHAGDRLVIGNFIPQKNTWRMTLTYECINAASYILLYVFGKGKEDMVFQALKGPYNPELIPVQKVGTPTHKALWILDDNSKSLLAK